MLRAKPVVSVLLIALTAVACGSGGSKSTIAGLKANDHGTKDVTAASAAALELDLYYFSPSVLKGKPGQTVKLTLKNDSSAEHNFTIEDQNINEDLADGDTKTVTVTFPDSGVLSFFCEYHKDKGMAGGLLVSGSAAG